MSRSVESERCPDDSENDLDKEIRVKENRLFDDLEYLSQHEPDPTAPIDEQIGFAAEASIVRTHAEEIAELHKQRNAS